MTTLQPHKRLTLTVVIPLLIGGLTYILFRADSLVMFRWFDTIGLGQTIKTARQLIGHSNLPAWTIFSLPNALWIFSFTSFMLIIWRDKFSRQSLFWIFIAPTIGLLSEVGQAFHFIRGTFDTTDLTLILIASILPFITTIKNQNQFQ
ncbi:MAG: hypothetical protein EXR20_09445 [Bacteroidetes bacterium]|nr:hypothetical protein [Bacteroidota bacterium]